MYLSAWNKLIFLFLGVLILIVLNKSLNLDSFFGPKQQTGNINSAGQNTNPNPMETAPSPTITQSPSPTITPSPTPGIIKSIQRIRGGELIDD